MNRVYGLPALRRSGSIATFRANMDTAMRHIKVWVFEGTMASAITGPIDVLAAANVIWCRQNKDAKPIFEWRIESPDGKPVRTRSGIVLDVDGAIDTRRT